ncbi:DNA polymerase III subunit gamma/tau [Patescibacteria group bacterium]|nr:DNA polymerase III subunit gamma/tau [Patescibacteria group bacterium]MBU1034179.1 DNA polymerase III subunit gamma/tau [Patescibacteria group bacterium]MBU1629592.1 DNA polymerase III subunit gamma/tau [Patescibacteria group bacterium]MBU1907973.1 DNA polymerase III subunit gamma/tau [Patescibacteria group bacterium]
MSLSRKYRPQIFGDITDQLTVKETLRKEADTGKIGHAYIFSGPRGVGKTTLARIFSKAVNCLALKDGEPCIVCDSCREIQGGRALDIIEIDAASNRGIDNVREAIIEHVRFAPVSKKFKVYILDEAHMLTPESWNALLKTLEEPPLYAIFILATTELHKVPVTIISRCQRFDFRRVSPDSLAERLQFLAKSENVKLSPTVASSIVRHSEGCVRDAETLLDQLLALGEKNIDDDIAGLVIPISRLPRSVELLKSCLKRNLSEALKETAKLEDDGIPLLTVFDDLIHAVRLLLLAAGDPEFVRRLEDGEEGERMLVEVVGKFPPSELSDMALLFMERRRDAKQGIDPRFSLELAVSAISLGLLPNSPKVEKQAKADDDKDTKPKDEGDAAVPSEGESRVEEIVEAPEEAVEPVENRDEKKYDNVTLALVQKKWPQFVRSVGEKNPSLSFILNTTKPAKTEKGVVVISFQYPYHSEKLLGNLNNRRVIFEVLQASLGCEIADIDAVIEKDGSVKEKSSDDMVSNILLNFGGQIVD